MARETRSDARVASEGPRPTVKGGFSPPVARGPVPRDRWIARTMARDRPSPYDEGGAFCRRCPGRRAALLHRDQEVSPTGAIAGIETGTAHRQEEIETRRSLLLGKQNRSGCHETILTTTIAENFPCQIQEIMLKLPQCHHFHKEFACLHSISTANNSSILITSPCRFARWK